MMASRSALSRRAVVALAGLFAACALLPAAAFGQAEEIATLHSSFTPNKLGAGTTIGFSFHLSTVNGLAPPPLTSMDLHMPAGMNYVNTTLGLAICNVQTLERKGLNGCPANSRLGSGTAFVEVPFGKGAGHELPSISAYMGPPSHGNMVVLFYANGTTPVYGQFAFAGEVLPQQGVFGSQLSTVVPLVPSVPNGPDVSIVRVAAKIGPAHLTYYKREHGKLVKFKPRGIAVPERCPPGGFPFAAEFTFLDGSHTSARSTVPCPKAEPARRGHRRGKASRRHGGNASAHRRGKTSAPHSKT